MKKLFTTLLISFALLSNSQICSSYRIPDSLITIIKGGASTMAGSCASPDGPMLITAAPPPSYAWLLANGYCYSIGPQKVFTMCFTFSPAGSTATLNAGYSSTGCGIISFSGFNLYTCTPGCALIGSGLTFSGLTPGACYTWCFSGNCIGAGPGFDHVCPYYQTTVVLPIELLSFKGTKGTFNKIEWSTATERNNVLFQLERSIDAVNFKVIDEMPGAGNSKSVLYYIVNDLKPEKTLNYYRLKQNDFNGQYTYSNIIVIDNSYLTEEPIRIINTLGQDVPKDYNGPKFFIYSDGTIIQKP